MDSWSSVLALSLCLCLPACKGAPEQPTTAPGQAPAAEPPGAAAPPGAPAEEPPEPEPPTPAALAPVLRAVGPTGVVASQVVIQFPATVEALLADGPGEETRLSLDPPVAGDLATLGPTTWAFEPAKGLSPGTHYRVVLEAVGTRHGVVRPDRPWELTFATPAFSFVRLGAVRVHRAKHAADVLAVFTAPVAPAAVARFSSWTLDGTPVRQVECHRTGQAHTIRVRLLGVDAEEGSRIGLQLAAGLPHDADHVAPAAEATIEHEPLPEMRVEAVVLREGASGHYLDVICDDDAAAGHRSFWDNDTYDHYEVSARCLLTQASAAEHVHLTPKTDLVVAASAAGFRILGDLPRGALTLSIDGGARTVDGGRLAEPVDKQLVVPPRSPSVAFAAQGRYLPRSAWRNLAVRHRNVPELELTVRHVPRANLVFWLSGSSERADARTSNLVLKTKVAVDNPPDRQTTTWIDVGSLAPDPEPGVYELVAAGKGARASARLLLTDLNLVAKQARPDPGKDWSPEVLVWALDMETTRPHPRVEVGLVRRSGQVLARCTTGPAGGCRLKLPDAGVDDSPPFALIAGEGRDFTYLKLSDLKARVPDALVHGAPYRDERPYRAGMYSDRDVFRPGETAHVVAILRARDHAAPKAELPVELQLVDPRQRVARRVQGNTNAAGVVAFDLPLADFADTGRYAAKALVGKETVGTLRFNVEEFVPERMKATAALTAPHYAWADEASVRVQAEYLFGGSAEDSEVELTCRVEPAPFTPADNADFHYGDAAAEVEPRDVDLGSTSGALDAQGQVVLRCPQDERAARRGHSGKLVADAAVLEAGSGRTTRALARAPVHPERFYLGLKTRAAKAEPGHPFSVEGIVVDWDGKPVTHVRQVEVEVQRLDLEYGWYWDDEEGEEDWRRSQRASTVHREAVAVKDGRFSLSFSPKEACAGMRVRAQAGNARTSLDLEGTQEDYSWRWYSRGPRDSTPRPERPAELPLQVPESIDVGQLARVVARVPYKGRILFTVETDRVLTAEWLDAVPGDNPWAFTVDRFRPNVYVSALLVKDPHLDSQEAFLPDRALGVRSVRVNPADFVQTVELTTPEEVRPGSPLKVRLDLGKLDAPAFATVAAVDEGILSLTRFSDPDPVSLLFSARALGVETFETVGWAVRGVPGGPSSRTGGGDDEDEGSSGRIMPVRPVALWSGVVPVPEEGRLEVDLVVPRYRGALRVMVVTAGRTRLGRASSRVVVRDPIVLQTTLPRFLVAGDRVQIPVFVTNLSGADRDVTVRLATEELAPRPAAGELAHLPALEVENGVEKQLRIAQGKSGTVVFLARALRQAGAARLRVEARAGDLLSLDELLVPFSPAGPRVRRTEVVRLQEGTTDLKPHLTGWVPGSERTTLWVSTLRHPAALSHLSHLIRYPYGCIEQTTSSTRPLLFVSALLQGLDPELVSKKGGIGAMVAHGIERVLSMQTPAGGFSYWPGGTHPDAWGTAYASHMLLDARERGHAVPKGRLDEALAWLQGAVTSQQDRARRAHAEAYMHYVLARAGRARRARMRQLLDTLGEEVSGRRAEERYLLLAGLHRAGDRSHEAELKRLDVSQLSPERRTGGSFYSDLRRRGRVLATFADLFGRDPAAEGLAGLVAEGLSKQASASYTTQELVWGITGLGRWSTAGDSAAGEVTLLVDGKPRPPLRGAGSGRTWRLGRASERGALAVRVHGAGAGRYLLVRSHGVRAGEEVVAGGEGLEISRAWLGSEGEELDVAAGELGLGDLVYAKIRLTNTTRDRIDNVALVDRFPAGWEIENPRLGRGGGTPEWVDADDLWASDYSNLRDDRLEAFGRLLPSQTVEVVYALRAVSAGTFSAPPVEAEAMYDPRLWAREPGGRVEVSGPWAEYLN